MDPTETVDAVTFRQVLGHYPTGVSVITSATHDGTPAGGMVVGTFTSVSLDPPLVAFLPDKSSTSWPAIADTGRFCVNVLSADQEALCQTFAARGGNKFTGVAWQPSPSGTPILEGVVAWVDCSIEQVVESGDHYIVVGRVMDLAVASDASPLTFHRGGFGQVAPASADNGTGGESREGEMQRLAAHIFRPADSAGFTEEIAALAQRYVDGYEHLAGSRSDLIVTILSDYLQHLVDEYEQATAESADAAKCLTTFLRSTLEANVDHRAAAILYQSERPSLVDTDTSELVRLEQQMQQRWTEAIDQGKREGVFRSDADSVVTYFLTRDALFLVARWFRVDGRLSLDELLAQCSGLLMQGLAKVPSHETQ